jgi:hypothetical protein
MWLSVLAMLVLGTISLVVTSGLRDEPVRVALAMLLPVVFMLRGIKKRSLSISGAVAGWAVVCAWHGTGTALAGFLVFSDSLPARSALFLRAESGPFTPGMCAIMPSPSALNLVRSRQACAHGLSSWAVFSDLVAFFLTASRLTRYRADIKGAIEGDYKEGMVQYPHAGCTALHCAALPEC